MRNRVVRSIVVLLLVGIGAGAAIEGWRVARATSAAAHARNDLDGRLDALLAVVADIRTAQAGYVVPGQNPAEGLERFPVLLREASAGPAAIGASLRSPEASEASGALRALADATSRLAQADGRARDDLLLGDVLTASHIIFGEARGALDAMATALSQVRNAEATAQESDRSIRMARASAIGAAAGSAWIVGLIALAFLPSQPPPGQPASEAAGRGPLPADPVVALQPNLMAAADLCTEIARVETAAALSTLLDRTATLLDAAGVIVWLGAGEELFPVATHGYDAEAMGRFGPVTRHGESAASSAWRLGEMQIVHGQAGSLGAIAAPMFGRDACSGVFAVELREGREADASMRAVVTMIAAQLASIMPGWPEVSSSPAGRATGT